MDPLKYEIGPSDDVLEYIAITSLHSSSSFPLHCAKTHSQIKGISKKAIVKIESRIKNQDSSIALKMVRSSFRLDWHIGDWVIANMLEDQILLKPQTILTPLPFLKSSSEDSAHERTRNSSSSSSSSSSSLRLLPSYAALPVLPNILLRIFCLNH